jgi:hypothetical protein
MTRFITGSVDDGDPRVVSVGLEKVGFDRVKVSTDEMRRQGFNH